MLELAQGVSGPFAGRLLRDLGAEVCKAELPAGDPARELGPFFEGRGERDGGGLFAYLNHGKHLVRLDWKSDDEGSRLAELVDGADILLVDEEFASSYDELRELHDAHPRLAIVAATPFGMEGPHASWRGSDAAVSAYGGLTLYGGEAEREPITPPYHLASFQCGIAAAIGAMVGLAARSRTGRGQIVDVSAVDVLSTIHTGLNAAHYVFGSRSYIRAGQRSAGSRYPYTVVRSKDGYLRVIAISGKEWRAVLELMGNPDWANDPRFSDRFVMQEQYAEELDAHIEAWASQHLNDELFAMCLERGIPFAPLRQPSEVLEEPQLLHRGFFRSLAFPGGNEVRVPGPPYRLDGTRESSPVAAPTRPEDESVPFAWKRPPSETTAWGTTGGTALDGILVLDLGMVWAGSICGQMLGDFGANVIKIESRTHLDLARQGRPIVGDEYDPEQNPMFHNVARNKRSLALDLKTPQAQEIVRRLAERADVLIENMRPGALDRLGLGYEALRQLNPRLIYISQSIAGQDGPTASLRGYGPTISGITGLDSLIGYPGEPPLGMAHAYADPNVGMYAAALALAALEGRQHSGRGVHVDLSMWEAMVSVLPEPLLEVQMTGREPAPSGNDCVPGAPADVFPCAGEDSWLLLEVHSDEEWDALRDEMGDPEWAHDARYASVQGRCGQRRELNARVSEWTRSRDRDDIAAGLQQRGIIAAPCLTAGERLFDEHLQARENFVWIENPLLGDEPLYGQPVRLSETPGSVRTPAPTLGQHSREVLEELLGMQPHEIDALVEEDVLR